MKMLKKLIGYNCILLWPPIIRQFMRLALDITVPQRWDQYSTRLIIRIEANGYVTESHIDCLETKEQHGIELFTKEFDRPRLIGNF